MCAMLIMISFLLLENTMLLVSH